MKSFESETRSRYGATAAYSEHEQKTKNYTKEKWAEANDGMMAIFAEFSVCKQSVQRLILTKHRRLLPSFRHTSRITTTLAPMRSLQGLARCMLLTNDSRRTSISMAKELPSLHLKQSRFIVENDYKQIQVIS